MFFDFQKENFLKDIKSQVYKKLRDFYKKPICSMTESKQKKEVLCTLKQDYT